MNLVEILHIADQIESNVQLILKAKQRELERPLDASQVESSLSNLADNEQIKPLIEQLSAMLSYDMHVEVDNIVKNLKQEEIKKAKGRKKIVGRGKRGKKEAGAEPAGKEEVVAGVEVDTRTEYQKTYDAILPYVKIAYSIEGNGIVEEHAQKLATILGSKQAVLNYLKKQLTAKIVAVINGLLKDWPDDEAPEDVHAKYQEQFGKVIGWLITSKGKSVLSEKELDKLLKTIEEGYKRQGKEKEYKELVRNIGEKIKAGEEIDIPLGLANFQLMHESCSFVLPEGSYDLSLWQEMAKVKLSDKEFREILFIADEIEKMIKEGEYNPSKVIFAKLFDNAEEAKRVQNSNQVQQISALLKEYKKAKEEKEAIVTEKQKLQKEGTLPPEYKKDKLYALDKKMMRLKEGLVEIYPGQPLTTKTEILILQAFHKKYRKDSDSVYKIFSDNYIKPNKQGQFANLDRSKGGLEIPDITIDGALLGYSGCYLKKIPVQDERFGAKAAVLGKLSNCCQSLSGEAGEPCTIYGLTSPHSGFYMLCEGDPNNPQVEDKLLAQTWAWRSKSGAIVFDSIEASKEVSNNEDEQNKVEEMFNYLGYRLVKEGHVEKVAVGQRSGISNKFGEQALGQYAKKEHFKDYHGYNDSGVQKTIVGRDALYLLFGKIGIKNDGIEQSIEENLTQMFSEEDVVNNKDLTNLIVWAYHHNASFLTRIEETASRLGKSKEFLEIKIRIEEYVKALDAKDWYKIFELNTKGLDIDVPNQQGLTALMIATMDNDIGKVQTLIDLGADLNRYDINGMTPAIFAAKYNRREMLQFMIKIDKRILQAEDSEGMTPAIWAAKNKDEDSLELMMKLDPDVLLFDDDYGNTPALCAVENGLVKSFTLMLEVNKTVLKNENANGDTPALLAVKKGNKELLKLMIDESAGEVLEDKDQKDNTLAVIAAQQGHAEILELIIDSSERDVLEDKDEFGNPLAIIAVKNNHIDTLNLMIDRSDGKVLEHEDEDGNTPVILAAKKGRSEILELMIEKSKGKVLSDRNKEGKTPLLVLAEKMWADMWTLQSFSMLIKYEFTKEPLIKNKDLINVILLGLEDKFYLLKQMKEVSESIGKSDEYLEIEYSAKVYLEALYMHKFPKLFELHNQGWDLDFSAKDGLTALMIAAKNNDVENMQKLIDLGVDLRKQDKNGYTAAIWAVEKGHQEALELLTNASKGDVLDDRDNNGKTFAIWAAKKGNKKLLEFLIEKSKRNVLEDKDGDGNTLAMWAAKGGHKELLKLLIAKSKENVLYDMDDEGNTSAIWAARYGKVELLHIILDEMPKDHIKKQIDELITIKNTDQKLRAIISIMDFLIQKGDLESVDNFFSTHPELLKAIGNSSRTLAHLAASEGRTKLLELMIKTDPEVLTRQDASGQTPVFNVVKLGHLEILDLILRTDPKRLNDENYYNETPISIAQKSGNKQLLQVMYKYISEEEIKQELKHLLSFAIIEQKHGMIINMMDSLIEAGRLKELNEFFSENPIVLEERDPDDTLAIRLAQDGNVEVLKFLIENHPRVFKDQDTQGNDLLAISINNFLKTKNKDEQSSYLACAIMLIEHGADTSYVKGASFAGKLPEEILGAIEKREPQDTILIEVTQVQFKDMLEHEKQELPKYQKSLSRQKISRFARKDTDTEKTQAIINNILEKIEQELKDLSENPDNIIEYATKHLKFLQDKQKELPDQKEVLSRFLIKQIQQYETHIVSAARPGQQ